MAAAAATPTFGKNHHPCCVHIDDCAPARRGPAAAAHCSSQSSPPPPAAAAVASPNGGRLHHRTATVAGPRPDGHRDAEATPATDGRSGVRKDNACGCPPNHKPLCTAQEPPSPNPSTTFGGANPPGAALPLAPVGASSGLLEPSGKRSSDIRHPTAPQGHAPGATVAAGSDPRPETDGFLVTERAGSPQASSSICLYHSVLSGSIYMEAKDNLFTPTKSSDGTAGIDAVSGMFRASIGSDASDESNLSGSVNKPHKANDSRWEAIRVVRCRNGFLGTDHFRILRQLGCGDIGTVYLAELRGTRSYFAVKRMDKEALASRKKLLRAQTEKEILQCLDHPFLPTLYTHFETDKFSYLIMEFCPGGDLHTLRQRQPGKHFSEQAARFYVAEVLLALEYLHMLGIIYRDLKPENVLVREDGHIMLSDFDLSLRCAVCPTLVKSSSTDAKPSKKSGYRVQPSCVEPSCTIQPSCIQPTCFAPHFFTKRSKKVRKPKRRDDVGTQVTPLPELIAEPTNARSMSFVGTHEYLAPEIIKGEGHGGAVDWWTFGIFLYELLFGRTPFKGSGNRATLFNVVGEPLRFPESPVVSFAARDLIRGLLVKEPQHRLAYRRGATEVKQHPFFHSVNWALIRCASPPEVPRAFENVLDVKSSEKYLDMNFF